MKPPRPDELTAYITLVGATCGLFAFLYRIIRDKHRLEGKLDFLRGEVDELNDAFGRLTERLNEQCAVLNKLTGQLEIFVVLLEARNR